MNTRRTLLTLLSLIALGAGSMSHGEAQAGCTPGQGNTNGNWNLPPDGVGSTGFLRGRMVESGTAVYRFQATLSEVGSPCLACRQGGIVGTLDDGVGAPDDYVVIGSWFGSFFGGVGGWQATVFQPLGPALIPVGRMKGTFEDPRAFPDQVGAYLGRWTICD
jgi:hypothetical protein